MSKRPDSLPDTRSGNALARNPALARLAMLAVLTLGIGWLCLQMALPFVSSLTWALTLAVLGGPMHRWLQRKMGLRTLAALAATAVVSLVVALPALIVGATIAQEVVDAAAHLDTLLARHPWASLVERYTWLEGLARWLTANVDFSSTTQQVLGAAAASVRSLTVVSIHTAISALITVFFLFYFFRDHALLLEALPRFLPLSEVETREIGGKVRDTIEAMVYGTVAVAALQGLLGGVAFWLLGLPSPVLWGAVMMVLSLLPMFGAALVWMPAAGYLALQGRFGAALLLIVCGALLIGLIDNLLKPMLIRRQIHLHTVAVFMAMLGGLAVFGAAGLVLGPVVLAVGIGLLDVWRRLFGARQMSNLAPASQGATDTNTEHR
ncbi:MAG: AI-2E family transporter [Casimicrobiaceae bacterium]